MAALCPVCGAYWDCECDDTLELLANGVEMRGGRHAEAFRMADDAEYGGTLHIPTFNEPLTVQHIEAVRDEFRERFGQGT